MKRLVCSVLLITLLAGCAASPASTTTGSSLAASSVVSSSGASSPEASSLSDLTSTSLPDSSLVQPASVKIVIPEGYTLARIGITLEEAGICTAKEFIEAAQTDDFTNYTLIAAQAPNPNRCFTLEGYLFPDTYIFPSDVSVNTVIRTMLNNTEKQIPESLRSEIAAQGYTVDEILTLASIIEKEAFGAAEMNNISGVLHNRLKSGTKLECDVSIKYVEGAIKPFIEGDKDRYNSYYNTYKCAALPAGAICNPGKAAILAALNPTESDYMFFFTDKDKKYHYNVTYEEHQSEYDALKAKGLV